VGVGFGEEAAKVDNGGLSGGEHGCSDGDG